MFLRAYLATIIYIYGVLAAMQSASSFYCAHSFFIQLITVGLINAVPTSHRDVNIPYFLVLLTLNYHLRIGCVTESTTKRTATQQNVSQKKTLIYFDFKQVGTDFEFAFLHLHMYYMNVSIKN